jgi:uncharacterized protein (TIGR03435 family)
MRQTFCIVSCILTMLASGCDGSHSNKASREPTSTSRDTADHQKLPPEGQELSTVEGVSIVRVTDAKTASTWIEPNKLTAEGATLHHVITSTLASDTTLTNKNNALPAGTYDITVKFDDPLSEDGLSQAALPFLAKALESTFPIQLKKTTQPVDGYELHAADDFAERHKADPDKSWSHGTSSKGYRFTAVPIAKIELWAQNELETEIVDKTKLKGRYSFNVKTDPFDDRSVIPGLADVGLKLEPAEVESTQLVVTPTGDKEH